ncbi:MAG: cation diffusion facilitator family transporter [Erysipelotrichaceae bacterium]
MINFLIKTFVKDDNRYQYGLLSGIVGIIANFLLFSMKLLIGILSGSLSVMADAFNNLSDSASSVVTMVGFKLSNMPADKDHPFGHGRSEYIAGLVVAFAIALMGFELFKSSITKIFNPSSIEITTITLVILVVSIIIKVWLFFFNNKIGKLTNSQTIKATSKDALFDVLSTTVILVGVLVENYWSLRVDAYLGVMVSIFILYNGYETIKDTLSPLLGEAPDQDFVSQVKKKVMSYPNIVGIHDMMVHNYGNNKIFISLHAELPSNIDVMLLHDEVDNIERDIKKEFNCDMTIHMDPVLMNDKKLNKVKGQVIKAIHEINENFHIHDFRIVEGVTHTNLIFDVVVPFDCEFNNDVLYELVYQKIKKLDNTYELVLNIDQDYVQ